MLPSKVNICGIPYDVVLCDDLFASTETNLGQIVFSEAKIKINSNAAPPVQEQTLVHEIVHGMLTNLGFAEDSADEQFVQSLACAINQTFAIRDCEDKQKKPVDDDGLKEAETEMLKSFMAVGEKYLEGASGTRS